METTRKSFDVALAKGEYGESIVRAILEEKGFVVYKPTTKGAHAFDVLAIKDKARCIALDVKAKARRNKYADTGINLRHYHTYKTFSEKHCMPFWIVFVDEMLGKIYGNTIEELDKPRTVDGKDYPFEWHDSEKATRYWPIDAMLVFRKLDERDLEVLRGLSQRTHLYLSSS
jgi:hypothetical protein